MEGKAKGVEGSSVLNRIMPKYRPIAPKPFTGGIPSDKLPKRTKRKYVRKQQNDKPKMTGKQRAETLQLFPLMIEENSGDSSCCTDSSKQYGGGSSSCEVDPRVGDNHDHWLSLGRTAATGKTQVVKSTSDPSAVMDRMESWVTVECVRGTCMTASTSSQSFLLGLSGLRTDEERIRRLMIDTSPGFISDCWNRVQWLNGAFMRMMTSTTTTGQQQVLPEVTVWLWMNEELQHTTNTAFTCQVKLKYTTVESQNKDKNYYSQLVPCDLWRMDGGGFAWRLDVKAALTLGG